jgi:hypothetical protein
MIYLSLSVSSIQSSIPSGGGRQLSYCPASYLSLPHQSSVSSGGGGGGSRGVALPAVALPRLGPLRRTLTRPPPLHLRLGVLLLHVVRQPRNHPIIQSHFTPSLLEKEKKVAEI